MPKDGCNNMEKNKILRLHKAGNEVADIARHLRLTERIVKSMIDFHAGPAPKPKSKPKKKKAKKKAEPEAAEEFEDDFD